MRVIFCFLGLVVVNSSWQQTINIRVSTWERAHGKQRWKTSVFFESNFIMTIRFAAFWRDWNQTFQREPREWFDWLALDIACFSCRFFLVQSVILKCTLQIWCHLRSPGFTAAFICLIFTPVPAHPGTTDACIPILGLLITQKPKQFNMPYIGNCSTDFIVVASDTTEWCWANV